ncbi:unnamed protein product, partial [Staurois parvus]
MQLLLYRIYIALYNIAMYTILPKVLAPPSQSFDSGVPIPSQSCDSGVPIPSQSCDSGAPIPPPWIQVYTIKPLGM